ncbi:spermatogenesis-associated protein 6 isoform X3 [Gadus morhua]|uniref:spermatogenesis-associated protein 6 isoform X3 n=1 Tax=Gadus morhua TaxID=8049 RepID=UPI0011B3EE15|nr:spermatogenesis-associated protein 6 isoform X3 [Gadus morhua]
MKEPTPVKLSSCKSYQKILKCTVYLDIHSTFPGVVDPADVSEQLESDTSTLELIQTVPPEGEILATVEEGTRDFVFPGPRLTASEEAPERQILMRKSSSFPGIAPMVEFATTAVIEEMDAAESQPATPLCGLHPERSSPARPRRSPRKKTTMSPSLRSISQPSSPATLRRTQGDPGKRSPSNRAKEKDKTGDSVVSTESPGTSPLPAPTKPVSPRRRRQGSQRTRPGRGQLRGPPPRAEASPRYQQPTVASVSRALSPYTHRRMCELSEDAQARLAHLQLGPHHFRKQTLSQPPFQVPFHSDVSFSESPSYQPVSPTRDSVLHRFGSARYTADHPVIALDSSLLGSYRPELAESQSGSTATGLSPEAQRSCRGEKGQTGTPVEKAWSIPGPSSSRSPPPLGHSSIQERLHCSPSGPSQWEQIHSRVQRILQTHGASPKRLTEEEKEERQERSGDFCGGADCGPPAPRDSDSPGGWAGGIYGSKQGSRDGFPRPHRLAFEESLGKIYQSMYQKATHDD